MRISCTLETYNVLAKTISLRMTPEADPRDLPKDPACLLVIPPYRIEGAIQSSSRSAKGRSSIVIRIARAKDILGVLYDAQGASHSLHLAELVDPALYQEAESLLHALSVQTGQPCAELLLKLTEFRRGVEGRPSLKFVSEAQLKVIVDKMRDELESSTPKKEAVHP